jgi:phosphoribosyl 1,2-cyclic phosphate phosphodiesterase
MTHPHADQTNGIDDLRPLALLTRTRIDMYADTDTLQRLRHQFGYCFETPEGSDYPPIIKAHEIPQPFEPFDIAGSGGNLPVLPFFQTHGRIRSLGFRFGPLAYSSDVNELDDTAIETLKGVECWIVDALRYKAHPSHANVETALSWISRVRPKRAILTNLHNDLDYEALSQELPPGVEPAYDGMRIEL